MDDAGIEKLADDGTPLAEPVTNGSDSAESSDANTGQYTELVSTGATAQDVETSCQGVSRTIADETSKVVSGIERLTDSVNAISKTLTKEDTRNGQEEVTYTVVLDSSQVQTIESYGQGVVCDALGHGRDGSSNGSNRGGFHVSHS